MTVSTAQLGLFGQRRGGGFGRRCAIWTARISYRGPNRLDVTRKGGSIFGPSWPLLNLANAGGLRWPDYVCAYTAEMRMSWQRHRDQWLRLLRQSTVVLCCYCQNARRCHRTVLAELLIMAAGREGLGAMYCGETR